MIPVKKLLKNTTILLMLLLLHPAFSQNSDLEKDTIQMKELVVVKKSKKLRLKTLVLEGPCYYPENMHQAGEIITLADKLPGGTLESVTFYFNELYSRREQKERFRDNKFAVVFYNVNTDGMPGDSIAHEPLTVTVDHTFSGKLSIDISGLVLQSPGKMFVGLKRLTPAVGKDEFLIDCLCSGHDKYLTLVRTDTASPWERRWQCAALRTEISVAVPR